MSTLRYSVQLGKPEDHFKEYWTKIYNCISCEIYLVDTTIEKAVVHYKQWTRAVRICSKNDWIKVAMAVPITSNKIIYQTYVCWGVFTRKVVKMKVTYVNRYA